MVEVIIAIISMLIAFIGISIAYISHRRSVLDAIWQWTQLDGRQDVVDARLFVQYELKEYDPADIQKNKDTIATKIAPIINAYHHLGMLMKRHYISARVFKRNSTGITIIGIFEKLRPYINAVRENNNKYYASGFEYLYSEVKKYHL